MTRQQLEMLKDLHLALKSGFKGISIRQCERHSYLPLERDALVYFLNGFGRGDNCSVRLTDKGSDWATSHFAYAYQTFPHHGQTTYQDESGNVILVC